jgi:hypothetical protein
MGYVVQASGSSIRNLELRDGGRFDDRDSSAGGVFSVLLVDDESFGATFLQKSEDDGIREVGTEKLR